MKLFNFRVSQESLIAYQNLDLVNAFEYFDDKNRERVGLVKEKITEQKSNMEEVRDIVRFIKRKMSNKENPNNVRRGSSALERKFTKMVTSKFYWYLYI